MLDQSYLPGEMELQVRRIDFFDMPLFGTEQALLEQYLDRNHAFRHRLGGMAALQRRAILRRGRLFWRRIARRDHYPDDLGALRLYAVHADELVPDRRDPTLPVGARHGSGTNVSSSGVGTSTDFATRDNLTAFDMVFGSYSVDWDQQDNLVRAPIAGTANSLCVASLWGARPHTHLYSMGMGAPIGEGVRATQQNDGDYLTGSPYDAFLNRMTHVALMGDPTLRLHHVQPPTGLIALSFDPGEIDLAWTASPDSGIEGYAVYRADAADGPYFRLGGLVAGTAFSDASAEPGAAYHYMVRAVKLESAAGGTYLNPSQGITASGTAGSQVTAAPHLALEGPGGAPIAPGAADPRAADGTFFGGASTRVFTLRNFGNAALTLGTPAIQITGPGAAGYAVANDPADGATIAAVGEATFEIAYAPTAAGDHSATLTINSDAANAPTYTASLDGADPVSALTLSGAPVEVVVSPGGSASPQLTLGNAGGGTLTYTIAPDYDFRWSGETGGPAHAWNDIAGTGTAVSTWNAASGVDPLDEGSTPAIPLGFSFPFYGGSYTALYINANGILSLADLGTANYAGARELPSPLAPPLLIAPLWDDLMLDGSSAVYHQGDGSSFTVQFENVHRFGSASRARDLQAVLRCQRRDRISLRGDQLLGGELFGRHPGWQHRLCQYRRDQRLVEERLPRSARSRRDRRSASCRRPPPCGWLLARCGQHRLSVTMRRSPPRSIRSARHGSAFFNRLRIASNDPAQPQLVASVQMLVDNAGATPVLAANMLIAEGATVALTDADLLATDGDNSPAELTFTPSNVAGGTVLAGRLAGASFTQADVDAGNVSFQHDGGEVPAGYDISVSDGSTTVGPAAAAVTYTAINDPPALVANALTLAKGESVVFGASELLADDPDTADADLDFSVTGVSRGQFEFVSAPGVAITTFSQADLLAGDVAFIHDGSLVAPAYSVEVTDGEFTDGPAAAAISFTPERLLIAAGADWKYLDDGTDQGTAWRAPGFDDSTWASGPAQLGYGDGDEATVVGYGPSSSNKFITTYFRHDFTLADPASVHDLILEVVRDDGVVVYLNGTEVARDHMPSGTIGYQTRASNPAIGGADEDAFQTFTIDKALLVAGSNTLAAEIHQQAANSSDISFDLRLTDLDIPQAITRGPYLQTATADGMTLRWRTQFPAGSVVRYGSAPGSLTDTAQDLADKTEHSITIAGLAPDTRYYYSVETPGEVLASGADYYFETLPPPEPGRPLRFWVLGDSGTADANAAAVRDAFYAENAGAPVDAVLMLGDNAYDNGTDAEYQAAVFDMYPSILRNTPLWPTLGNHDENSADSPTQSGVYYDIFHLPAAAEAGGLPSGTEAYYSFNYGDIHFVCLDSQDTDRSSTAAMAAWLENDLAAATQEWIIAFWHHPPYTKGSHDSDNIGDSSSRMQDMREVLPILENGDDLILAGTAIHERSYLAGGTMAIAPPLFPT
ncbi:MAG: cadherin-like domain-containing protein [Verrucomicrobiales bacterium]